MIIIIIYQDGIGGLIVYRRSYCAMGFCYFLSHLAEILSQQYVYWQIEITTCFAAQQQPCRLGGRVVQRREGERE